MVSGRVGEERRTEKLDFRVTRAVKTKLQAAATAVHRSVSDFVLESALARAEESLADRRVFALSAERWSIFQGALDAPVRDLAQLRALLKEPGFFDEPNRRRTARKRATASGSED